MVDISGKPETTRVAIAKGEVVMNQDTLSLVATGNLKKGDLIAVAQIAGVMAAKRTAELIPLCHPLQINHVDVEITLDVHLPGVQIVARVSTNSKTGVEMEALTAVSVAALAVYDMAKAVDKKMRIQNIHLVEKHGGQSGDFVAE
jgi:cyclic pyranopterin phosphate synthase